MPIAYFRVGNRCVEHNRRSGTRSGQEGTIQVRAVVAVFDSAETASHPVAGLPAAARALHRLAQAGVELGVIAAPGLSAPDPLLEAEVRRLCPNMEWLFTEPSVLPSGVPEAAPVVPGEALLEGALPDLAAAPQLGSGPDALAAMPAALSRAAMRDAAARIVRATAKPGDGIVSRHLNRPISQACTRLLLGLFPRIRPIHATFGTAAIALAMAFALLGGTERGLVLGALLFQAASIFDGVDGEIARATWRSSPQGAALDSLIDALTNLACVAGVAWNLHLQGQERAAMAGALGLVAMGLGLWVLGRRSRKDAGGMTFNAVKDRFSQRPSAIKQWLTWLTMRDFYALAGAVLIAAGFAHFALYAFAVVAVGWLAVVLTVMMREPA